MRIATVLRLAAPIAFSVLALSAAQLQADNKVVYKWTDEKGQVHYSERKPAGVAAEAFKVSSGRPVVSEGDNADPESDRVETAENAEEKADPEAFKDPERCAAAKRNIETINNNARLRFRDPKTEEYRYLTPKEIEDMKAENQKAIEESC